MNDLWAPPTRLQNNVSERLESAPQADHGDTNHQQDLAVSLWKELESSTRPLFDAIKAPAAEFIKTLSTESARIISSPAFRTVIEKLDAAEKQAKAQATEKKTEWTVVLNLTTDFDGNKDGSFNRLEDLKAFAEKTKGKNLAVVVQAAFKEPKADGSAEPNKYRLERYLVKDGVIKRVAVAPSKGYGQDLEDLVEYASHKVPSNKMALILDSHGSGNEGLLGDTGTLSLPAFVDRVKAGLKGSSRDKFDLIDFDACLMAQNGVLARMSSVTKDVVASAELEPAKGISLIPSFTHLLQKPNSDGRALGRDLVNEGRLQTDALVAKGQRMPIRTIAHIELKEYEGFREALDQFGDKMAGVLNNPASRRMVERIIDSSRRYSLNEWDDTPQADLKDFIQRVVSAVDDGRLPDPDRSLKKAANKLELQLGNLVDAFYGYDQFQQTGGVSVYLPTWYEREEAYRAKSLTPAGALMHSTVSDNFDDYNRNDESIQKFIQKTEQNLTKIKAVPSSGADGFEQELTEVTDAFSRFKEATDTRGRKEAFTDLHEAAIRLENTHPFRVAFAAKLKEIKKQTDHVFEEQLVDSGTSGWSRFQHALRKDKR